MFSKILIANRGEIAVRVIKTARRMGIATVAVYSAADSAALHVRMADEAVLIGGAAAAESYLRIEAILQAVRETGADAVHPGYGFLSERADFAAALEAAGIAFIGPPAAAIAAMGDKIAAKELAARAGVSTVPGHMGLIGSAGEAVEIAKRIGYPVMIKASAGGGGKGMRIATSDADAREGWQSARNEAKAAFGDDRIFIEKFIENPRHIEIQLLGDRHGNCLYLGERECSIQRRNQKVVEEAPSPFLDAATRKAMGEQAVSLAKAVDYCSAGTVEFIVDAARNFYFLEMNTRLQVEHPVTELVTGLDIVEQMIRVATGEKLGFAQAEVRAKGWALECRLYAEDPYRGFLPSTGRLTRYRPPAEVPGRLRNDTGVEEGSEISRYYDPMLAKLCAWGPDRAAAIEQMRGALDEFEVEGIAHNLPFCAALLDHPRFVAGDINTGFIETEFLGGFAGAELPEPALRRLAAGAACLKMRLEERAAKISGAMANHSRCIDPHWVVVLGARRFDVAVGDGGADVSLDGEHFRVETAWQPGLTLCRAVINGKEFVAKVDLATGGARLRYRGAELKVKVMTPRAAELAAKMPERAAPDVSRLVLCPMPGLVVALAVAEGDTVHAGQSLCTIEAMKMENVLKAERSGKVARLHAVLGASMAVDAVILEYEA